jgi:beta-galactosidase
MGYPKNSLKLIIFFFLLPFFPTPGQIVFKELPKYEIKSSDSLFFDISSRRTIFSLNGQWRVYPSDDEQKRSVGVSVPSAFEGNGELIFEKGFSISPDQMSKYKIKLYFLGLNYTADISVNDVIIYRHSGGEFPFSLDLPKDILNADKNNILSVKLYYELDSENTIPVKQRFLFPRNFGGIIRDVYLHLFPAASISDIDLSYDYNPATARAKLNVKTRIENKEFRRQTDTLGADPNFNFKISLINPDGSISTNSPDIKFELGINKERIINQSVDVSSVASWSPQIPQIYKVKLELWRGEELIDESTQPLSIYSLTAEQDSLMLNGKGFILNGTTYVPTFYDYGSLITYYQMERDIRIIKESGFNSVRFTKTVPHPYYLALCERYGLLAFIEIPINYVPGSITQNQNFAARSKNYLTNFIKAYKKYSALGGLGLGSSYLPELDSHTAFLHDLGGVAKQDFKKLVYASFIGMNIPEIENIDLYGVELFNEQITANEENLKNLQEYLGKGKVFISEASYIVNSGNTDGYVNEHSFEAQAKYFEELIDYSNSQALAGYFIGPMFDYRGDYAPLTGGYNNENLYHIGILGETRETSRLSYKVIFSKLHNTERVTIPIGSKRDDAPMIFIIFGLALAILMGVLVNSGRKFREDTSRALLRPYNFYADVRDQRMMSGYHSTLLAIVVSTISALLLANILFYLKDNIIFEKILLSFGSPLIMKTISYLAWNPLPALLWLSAFSAAVFIVLIIVIKISSFFVRNRVFTSSVYFSVVWSFLPLVLLIPLGIVLFRLLHADVANFYIFIALAVFTVWVFYRLMKGIYVIFDVPAGSVYLYSLLILALIAGAILLHFEINNSVIDYLLLTFKQYNIFG